MTNRKIHRWLSIIGVIFFLSVSATGVWMQGEQIFGDDEAEHEAIAALVSPARLSAPLPASEIGMDAARKTVLARYGNRPVAAVDWLIKAPESVFVFHLDGAEPLKVTVSAKTAAILKSAPDGEDWVRRLHTGEIFGDGGKFLGLAWGLALIVMSVTGIILYLKMLQARRRGEAGKRTGLRRYFW